MMFVIPLTAMVVAGGSLIKRAFKIQELKERLKHYANDSITLLANHSIETI